MQKTKKALLASALSIVVCLAMLIGSTFAWFTDSVTSGKNKIVAGNLDVALYQVKDDTETEVDENTNLFKEDTLWEPGHTEVVNLKVANEGSLALKYQLSVNIASETESTNVDGNVFKLSDYIMFALVDGNNKYDTGAEAIEAAETANPAPISEMNIEKESVLYPADAEEEPTEEYVTMIVYMPETVGNEANYRGDAVPTIDLGVSLTATQTPYEEDSFDDQYDAGAWLDANGYVRNENGLITKDGVEDTYYVFDADSLAAISENSTADRNFVGQTVILNADVNLSGVEWNPINDFYGTFDGNGHTISNLTVNSTAESAGLFGKNQYGSDSLISCTVRDLTIKDAQVTGGESTGVVFGNLSNGKIQNVRVENAEVHGGKYVGGIVGYSYNAGGAQVIGCTVTDSTIESLGSSSDTDKNGMAGGIIGMAGSVSVTIKDNTVSNCSITAVEFAGGIAGRNGTYDGVASFVNNTVSNNTLQAETTGEQYGDDWSSKI